MTKINIFLLIVATSLLLGTASLAQTDASQEVSLDEDIQAADLGVEEPNLLPDNPFYFLKNWGRGIQSLLTFDSIKKAELKLKFSNERLLEAKKLAEKNKDAKIIEKGLEKYEEELDNIKDAAEKIKDKAKDDPKVSSFLDKFTKQQILHNRILQKLETQVPEASFERIKQSRERHLERFGEVMAKLEDRKEAMEELLEESLEAVRGSKFKDFKNLEILKELEEKVPEQAREAVLKAQENFLRNLRERLEEMSVEEQERFKDYIENTKGETENKIEVLEDLRGELKEKPALREILLKTRENVLEIFHEEEEEEEREECPTITRPAPEFCKDGRIVSGKNPETDCPLPLKCIIPGEFSQPTTDTERACIAVWDPICGKNGRTYSNECFAKTAGVEVEYDGVCGDKERETD